MLLFCSFIEGEGTACLYREIKSPDDRCNEIVTVLGDKYVRNILRLGEATDLYPNVRVVDLTGLLSCEGGFTNGNSVSVFVPFITAAQIELDFNTGKYRDIAILKREVLANNKLINYTLAGSTFGPRQGQASLYKVNLKLQKDSSGIYGVAESYISAVD